MDNHKKIKRRGFVMTGGGAKGLFEAGVINAFHITGMEFDVITGSSIGAMNSIFFAEYLLRKRSLTPEQRQTPDQTIQAMDGLIRSYHRAWLMMPEKNIIDDSPDSPLGQLVADLQKFDLSLSDLTRLGWWWIDPQRGKLPNAQGFASTLRIGKELVERLGRPGELLRIFKEHRGDLLREVTRTYLKRFKMEKSLIPAGGEHEKVIEDTFTQPVTPLQSGHLSGEIGQEIQPSGKAERLVDPQRTFKEFSQQNIALRLTRANYRTGRLEISAYLTNEEFMRYMLRQAWRLDVADPEKMPLGSFRLQLPGNPRVVKAALASGRFPGVFTPFPFQDIYPIDSPDNLLLYQLLQEWVEAPQVQSDLKAAYQSAMGAAFEEEAWGSLITRWQKSKTIRDFFPIDLDTYIDGGTIDNTPSNTAVDATREWIDAQGIGKRDVILDLYVIFLLAEPKISRDQATDPLLTEVVKRTVDMQAVAIKTGDAVVVNTINTFGKSSEALARTLLALLESLKATPGQLNNDQRAALEDTVRQIASDQNLRGYLGKNSTDILERMETWASNVLRDSLPLHVEEIKIYPERMPLNTLSFTERLGYRKDYAIEMITSGCATTLWALRSHLETDSPNRDTQDEAALQLARKWMGFDTWPNPRTQDGIDQLEDLRQNWRCTRTECLFHKIYCQQS